MNFIINWDILNWLVNVEMKCLINIEFNWLMIDWLILLGVWYYIGGP